MTIEEMIGMARQRDVSDIHLSEGMPVAFRSCGRLVDSRIELSDDEIRQMILGLLPVGQRELFDQGRMRTLRSRPLIKPAEDQCFPPAGKDCGDDPSAQ